MSNLPEVLVIDTHDLRDPRPREVTPPVEDDVSDRRVELDSEEDPVRPHGVRGYEESVAVLPGRVSFLESVFNVIRGHSQMTSAERGREGGYPNSDAVREVA